MLLALTPVAAVGALLLALTALGTRRWLVGGVTLVAALVLLAVVAPRAFPDAAPPTPPGAPTLVVATANLQFGRADAAAVVDLVRRERVEVLGVQELTPDAEQRLADAGLGALLPFGVSAARTGAGGTGLASRYPLSPSGLVLRPGVFTQVTSRVAAPGAPVDIVVAHPAAPVFRADAGGGWAGEVTGLPGPAGAAGPARLVIGDFNATLDHRPLRELVERGHRDAAASLGDGLTGTWPTDEPVGPFAAIDHVLVSGPLVARASSTHRIAGSDHAALVVRLTR